MTTFDDDVVERLDELRNRIRGMRCDAARTLGGTAIKKESPRLIRNSALIQALVSLACDGLVKWKDVCEKVAAYCSFVDDAVETKELLNDGNWDDEGEKGTTILHCARALQAIADAGYYYCPQSMACYFRIVSKLHTQDGDEHVNIPSAGASASVPWSAYVTNECTHAYFMWRRGFLNRAEIVAALGKARTKLDQIGECVTEWKHVESRRLLLSVCIAVLSNRKTLITSKTATMAAEILDQLTPGGPKAGKYDAVELFGKLEGTIKSEVLEELEKAVSSVGEVLAAVGAQRSEGYAGKCLQRIRNTMQEVLQRRNEAKWGETVAEKFRRLADILFENATLTRMFVLLALREQQARVLEGSHCDASEALAAAATYGRLTNDWEHPAVVWSVRTVFKLVDGDGRLPPGRPISVLSKKGDVTLVIMPQIVRTICDVAVRSGALEADAELVECCKRMLRFFVLTSEAREQNGWRHEFAERNSATATWITAYAAMALGKFEYMLDDLINRTALAQFSHKLPVATPIGGCSEPADRGGEQRHSLDNIMYPDYGLASVKGPQSRESVGTMLQWMRAHACGVVKEGNSQMPVSAILHGPPGTGKTTFGKALAHSANVTFVEVTPSDLLQEGAAEMEGRARRLFRLLCRMRRTVILFDEFDSVLRKRPEESKTPETVYEFLLPGMLPKLQELHDSAREHRVCYLLATNKVGDLDPAATRRGRFDRCVGIYAPDVLTRIGYIEYLGGKANKRLADGTCARRVWEAVVALGGAQMDSLKTWLFIREPRVLQYLETGEPRPEFEDPPEWRAQTKEEKADVKILQAIEDLVKRRPVASLQELHRVVAKLLTEAATS